MENYHQQAKNFKIINVSILDIDKINCIEKELNLSITTMSFLEKTLLNDNYNFLKLIIKNQIIGIFSYYRSGTECDIISIGICKEFQKKGYGKKLIEYLKTQNIKKIYLEVSNKNQNALIFYKKFGFVKVGVRKNYFTKEKTDAFLLIGKI